MSKLIAFGTYEAKKKVNEYDDIVQELLAFDDENSSVTIVIDKKDADKTRYKMQRAANAVDKTARLRETNEMEDGEVALVFTLTEKFRGRWNKVDSGE